LTPYLSDIPDGPSWHDHQIPEFAGPALDALYGSLFASLPQLSLGELRGVSTYADRTAEGLRALFLYTRRRRAARVMNEGMQLSAGVIERFAGLLFERFADLARVDFHAIQCNDPQIAFQAGQICRFTLDEDIVIDLPATEAAYLADLGKSTRKTLRQNLARAAGLTHAVLPGAAVDASLVDQIIGFNHARLAARQRRSALDATAARQLHALVSANGMAGIVRMQGQLCAGTLASRIGGDVYSLVNAHDPAFDSFGMGNLSRHLMIVAAIRSGARRFHLLGGNFSSKRACGAQRRLLQHVVVYRNRWHRLSDLPHLAALACLEQRYWLGVLLDDGSTELRGSALLKAVAALARGLRTVKRRAAQTGRIGRTARLDIR
jgi:hypothetical protein